MMVDKLWYPALNVVAHFQNDFPSGNVPKKIMEMMAVAVTLAGIQEVEKKPYWMQGVSDKEGSPDVRTMFCEPEDGVKAPWCYQQDVEVVSYTKHSASLSLPQFVASTKLANTSSYDADTIVLVNVEAGAPLRSAQEWVSTLGATGKKNQVLVLGLVNPNTSLYRLAFVYPEAEAAIDFNPFELLLKQGYTTVRNWSRGVKARVPINKPGEKHCPFEKFGIECKLV